MDNINVFGEHFKESSKVLVSEGRRGIVADYVTLAPLRNTSQYSRPSVAPLVEYGFGLVTGIG